MTTIGFVLLAVFVFGVLVLAGARWHADQLQREAEQIHERIHHPSHVRKVRGPYDQYAQTRLYEMERARRELAAVYPDDPTAVEGWLKMPQSEFGGLSAREMLYADRCDEVFTAIRRLLERSE
jgi:hypothetical protein